MLNVGIDFSVFQRQKSTRFFMVNYFLWAGIQGRLAHCCFVCPALRMSVFFSKLSFSV